MKKVVLVETSGEEVEEYAEAEEAALPEEVQEMNQK